MCFFCTYEKKKNWLYIALYISTHTHIHLDIVFSSTVCGNDHSLDAAIFHLKKGGSSRPNCLLFLRWTNGTLLCDSVRREALHLDMSLGLRLTHPSQGNWWELCFHRNRPSSWFVHLGFTRGTSWKPGTSGKQFTKNTNVNVVDERNYNFFF